MTQHTGRHLIAAISICICATLGYLPVLSTSATDTYVQNTPAPPTHNITFSPPVALGESGWGVTNTIDFGSTGSFAVVMGNRTLLSTDGGRTFKESATATLELGCDVVQSSDNATTFHDFGNASALKDPGMNGTRRVTSDFANFWTFADNEVKSERKSVSIVFEGFPTALHCDHSYGTCPLRLQGSGIIRFGDGTLLQSAIVFYGPTSHPAATSVVLFRSHDGYTWTYVSTIANASDYPTSEEGPNEHDLTMLDYGVILAVIRMDGGDGLPTHSHKDYSYTYSEDGGETWAKLVSIPKAGCARPRLLMLGDGYAPLLMSGGRMRNWNTSDILLWVDWTGFGASYPPKTPEFDMFSLSYQHNLLATGKVPKFTTQVNGTTGAQQTTSYTALVRVAKCSAVVLYDMIFGKTHFGFSMRLDLHLDQGGEAGIHC